MSYRQKAQWWLPGLWEEKGNEEELVFHGYRVSFGGKGKDSGDGNVDGCTTICT